MLSAFVICINVLKASEDQDQISAVRSILFACTDTLVNNVSKTYTADDFNRQKFQKLFSRLSKATPNKFLDSHPNLVNISPP